MDSVKKIIKELRSVASPAKAKILARFFKTGPGEYGEGDVFLGLTVPQIRAVAVGCGDMPLPEIEKLLASKYHEVRLAGAFCLIEKAKGADLKTRKRIFDAYIKNRSRLNNWDLIDLSAPKVVGEYLLLAPQEIGILKRLSEEKSMWPRRIAILATHVLIRERRYAETLKLAEKYLRDKEDLMHKATGWMLREVGKRDKKVLVDFLKKHAAHMPRTMLRYALEKFPPLERERYMRKKTSV